MGFADQYFIKNEISALISENPGPGLGIIIVIPSFNEPGLIKSLESLWNCKRPKLKAEIITVINSPEGSDHEIIANNLRSKHEAEDWISSHQDHDFKFHIIYKPGLPEKHAGVGLARKIGMDQVAYRFNQINNPEGIIVNFDADSTCDDNYLIEIEKHFRKYPKTHGISIYFEHPLRGKEFSENAYLSIWLYELHLRYYKQALQFTDFPYYYHTVGSAFAVNTAVYCKQGGMNKQKAGEDFYFLQKIIPHGRFYELNTTRVIPSPRTSDRVPFGTGAAMTKMSDMQEPQYNTYNFQAFQDIKQFVNAINRLYKASNEGANKILNEIPKSLKDFLIDNNFYQELQRAQENSSELKSFLKQFFQWFNAFRIIRFLNISHEEYYQRHDVKAASKILLKELEVQYENSDLLEIYRKLDRGGFAE